ncbi:discoidin domain-containing protein [Clostridium sp. SHJSY1]|uniref:discoidin domain-containing protein n=1 Tax=Clostridium sp. SHJSY1 TaxID=2942483 RepID=UPI002874A8E0|nr:discoidin domain-containing protein [Clostridium sp. SHJSY1]MDS0525420.1 discoidin domain-containing protein [Clostridium sp. SHJSY1]
MKKFISKKQMIKRNQLRKKAISILGYLICLIFIIPNLSNLVNTKTHSNEYILAKKHNENYTPKLRMEEVSKALAKKISKDIITEINKKNSNIQKIIIRDSKATIAKSNETEKNNSEKSNTYPPSSVNGEVIKQTAPIQVEEQQGAPIPAKWDKVTASSELNSGGTTYKASYVNDMYPDTAWAEGKDGDGIGEWIKLERSTPFVIDGVGFSNGYQKSEYTYYANNRVKKVRVELSDGTSVTQELIDRIGGNEVYLGREISTTYVKITILEVYKGNKYQDTCISRIEAYH